MAIDEKEMREYLESFKDSLESIATDTSMIREGIVTIQEKIENIEQVLGPREDEGLPVITSSIVGNLEKIRDEVSNIGSG